MTIIFSNKFHLPKSFQLRNIIEKLEASGHSVKFVSMSPKTNPHNGWNLDIKLAEGSNVASQELIALLCYSGKLIASIRIVAEKLSETIRNELEQVIDGIIKVIQKWQEPK